MYVFTFEDGVPEEGDIVISVDVAAAVDPGPDDPDNPDNPDNPDDPDEWEELSASSRRTARALSEGAAATKLIGKNVKTPAGKEPNKAIMSGDSKASGFQIVSINFVEETTLTSRPPL